MGFDALGAAFDEGGPDADGRPAIKQWIEDYAHRYGIDDEIVDALRNIDFGDTGSDLIGRDAPLRPDGPRQGEHGPDIFAPETENIEQDGEELTERDETYLEKEIAHLETEIEREESADEPNTQQIDEWKGMISNLEAELAGLQGEEVVDEEVVDEEVVTEFIGLPVQEADELDHVKHLAGIE